MRLFSMHSEERRRGGNVRAGADLADELRNRDVRVNVVDRKHYCARVRFASSALNPQGDFGQDYRP